MSHDGNESFLSSEQPPALAPAAPGTTPNDATEQKAVTKLPGNRRNRRSLAAVARRIANRPGTGYNKRSAAGGRQGHQSAQRTLIIQMQDNAQVIDNVATGRLDKYLEAK